MKNVLITGGASGLGKEIAEHLLKRNFNIFIIDKFPKSDVDEIYLTKIKKFYEFDLSNIQNIIKHLVDDKFNIDILINNASVRLFKEIKNFSDQEIENYLKINLLAHIKLTQHVIHNSNFCKIIFISSRAGFSGYSTGSLYCGSKAFIQRFSESLAKELTNDNKGTSNIICPNSLSTLDGIKVKNYRKRIRQILKYIDKIIDKPVSGECYNTFSISEKVYFLMKTFKNIM